MVVHGKTKSNVLNPFNRLIIRMDFAMFPGSIVLTSNCLIEPMKSYKNRIFTRAVVGWPGVTHITGNDFSEVIEAAEAEEGFEEDEPERYITGNFQFFFIILLN